MKKYLHRSGCDWSGLKKWSCCSITNQCGENEGDCDSDAHCSNDLMCGTENCVGPHFHPLADCCFSAVAPNPPGAEVPFQDLEEENKEKRNFYYYYPTYAPPYTYMNPTTTTTTVEPPSNDIVHPRFFDLVGHETLYASSGNKYFLSKSFHRQTYPTTS